MNRAILTAVALVLLLAAVLWVFFPHGVYAATPPPEHRAPACVTPSGPIAVIGQHLRSQGKQGAMMIQGDLRTEARIIFVAAGIPGWLTLYFERGCLVATSTGP